MTVSAPTQLLFVFCLYGFLIDFKPSEPWITRYLRENKGLSDETLLLDVYPLWTYSYLCWILLMGVLAEGLLSHKSIVLVGSVARLATRVLLLWGTSLLAIQATQVTFGLASATEITYYAYVYSLTTPRHYQQVTSFTRASILISHVVSAVVGQVAHTVFAVPLTVLFYVSFASVSAAGLVSLSFPVPRAPPRVPSADSHTKTPVSVITLSSTFKDLASGYSSSPPLVRWSLWWILGFALHNLVLNYVSTLFDVVDPAVKWNGWVSGGARLAATFGALAPHKFHALSAAAGGDRTLALASGIAALALGFMSWSASIYTVYAAYIVYYGAFEVVVAVMATAVAAHVSRGRYAAVFALNTLLSLMLQAALQLLMGKSLLSFDVVTVFASLTLLMALISLSGAVATFRFDVLRKRTPLEVADLKVLGAEAKALSRSGQTEEDEEGQEEEEVPLSWPWSRAVPSATAAPSATTAPLSMPLLSSPSVH